MRAEKAEGKDAEPGDFGRERVEKRRQRSRQHDRAGQQQHLAAAVPVRQPAHGRRTDRPDQKHHEDASDERLAEIVGGREENVADVIVHADEGAHETERDKIDRQQRAVGQQFLKIGQDVKAVVLFNRFGRGGKPEPEDDGDGEIDGADRADGQPPVEVVGERADDYAAGQSSQ